MELYVCRCGKGSQQQYQVTQEFSAFGEIQESM